MCSCADDRAYLESALESLADLLANCSDEEDGHALNQVIGELERSLSGIGYGCPIHGEPVSFVFLSRLSICFRQSF